MPHSMISHLMLILQHPFLYFNYRVRYKHKVKDFPKLLHVVLSCQTYDQCKSAFFYLQLYIDQYDLNKKEGNKEFNIMSKIIMERIAMYLQDTMDHDLKGYHYSQIRGYEITKVWPDLTDYVGVLLDIKFPKIWKRNCILNTGSPD